MELSAKTETTGLLLAFFNKSEELYSIFDSNLTYIDVNEAFLKTFQLSRMRSLEKTWPSYPRMLRKPAAMTTTVRSYARGWEHQRVEADVNESNMLPESLSQYAALMVMKNTFPPEMIERYLKYELDNYLSGRSTEREQEGPLILADADQAYIFNNKASIVFYALQDYIGEKKLNGALKAFYTEQQAKGSNSLAPDDLLKEIRSVTPDSLAYLIEDMLETITLFENVVEDAVYNSSADGSYEVTIDVSCRKIRVDSTGRETEIPVNDWIDIGVYTRNSKGLDSLIHLEKYKFTERRTITLSVNQLPSMVGIDPIHKLIDKHTNDNTARPKQFVEISNILLDF